MIVHKNQVSAYHIFERILDNPLGDLTKTPGFCITRSVIELQKPARPATRGVPAGTPLIFLRRTFMDKPFLSADTKRLSRIRLQKNSKMVRFLKRSLTYINLTKICVNYF